MKCIRNSALKLVAAIGLIGGANSSVFAITDSSQFDTVINIPPDPVPTTIEPRTQLNIFEGAVLSAERLNINALFSQDELIEINVFGGLIQSELSLTGKAVNMNLLGGRFTVPVGGFFDGELNISGGIFEQFLNVGYPTRLNISGGTFLGPVNSIVGDIMIVSGGTFEAGAFLYDFDDTGELTISGGIFNGPFSPLSQGFTTITGGQFNGSFGVQNEDFEHTGILRLLMRDVAIDGVDVTASFSTDGYTQVTGSDVLLSGTLADGNDFSVFLDSNPAPFTTTMFDIPVEVMIVPEPASAGLLALSATVLAGRRRRL